MKHPVHCLRKRFFLAFCVKEKRQKYGVVKNCLQNVILKSAQKSIFFQMKHPVFGWVFFIVRQILHFFV